MSKNGIALDGHGFVLGLPGGSLEVLAPHVHTIRIIPSIRILHGPVIVASYQDLAGTVLRQYHIPSMVDLVSVLEPFAGGHRV